MYESNSSSHLDFLTLYKESRDVLSFLSFTEEKEVEDPFAIRLDLGGELPLSLKKGEVISPCFLYEVQEKRGTPVYFYRTEISIDNTTFHKKGKAVLNTMALSLLESYGYHYEKEKISLSYLSSLFDSKPQKEKLILVKKITFYSKDVISYSLLYPFLKDVIAGKDAEQKEEGLFREVKEEEIEKTINKKVVGPFARLDRIFLRLKSYLGATVTIEGEDIEKTFLTRFLNTFLAKGKKIAFYCSEEDKEKLTRELTNLGYAPLIAPSLHETSDKEKALLTYHLEAPDPKTSYQEREEERCAERYLSIRSKKQQCFVYPKDFLNTAFFEPFLEEAFASFKPYPLFLVKYTETDYEADKKALETISTLPTITSSYIVNHPFYGLTCNDDRESLSALQLLWINVDKDLKTLEEKIDNAFPLRSYSLSLTTGEEVETLLKDGFVLSGYNGFPRKYFRLNQDEEQKYSLSFLKKQYQSLSSSKLYLTRLCGESFFQEDFPSLIVDYESKNFFTKKKAERKLASYLPHPTKEDISLLVSVMKTYNDSKTLISSLLLDYISVYGDSVCDMNGVVEIESNIAYINSFRKRGEENKNFNLDNPWIKKVIRDKDFRLDALSCIEEINKAYTDLEKDINAIRGKYREKPEEKSWKKIPFEDLSTYFEEKMTLNYEEFHEYLAFRSAFLSSSMLLQRTIRQYYEDAKRPLTNLTSEYLYSLGVAYYTKGSKAFAPYQKDYNDTSKVYFEELNTLPSLLSIRNYQNVYHEVKKNQNDSSFEERRKNLGKKKEEIDALFLEAYPISLLSIEEATEQEENAFDISVLVNSSFFPTISLLNMIRSGKSLLALALEKDADKRIFGYHETLLNKNIYKRAYSFDKLTSAYIDSFEEEASLHNYKIVRDDPRYPFLLVGKGREYALLPDILVSPNEVLYSLKEYSEALASFENLILVEFDAYSFLEYPENLFSLLK